MEPFSFSGRANRMEFWLVGISLAFMMLLFWMFVGFIAGAALRDLDPAVQAWAALIPTWTVTLLFLWPALAVGVRRAHDRGASGRWFLIYQVLNLALSGWAATLEPRGVPQDAIEPLAIDLFSLLGGLWGLFLFVTLGFLPGQDGENRYGSPPGGRVDNYRAPPV